MRNKCKSFLKRFLCLTLALVVAMTSSSLDVLASTAGGSGSSSYTGTHVSNYIGKGIMGYRMYLVKNNHKQVVKGKATKDGKIKVLGASNYLLNYNKKNTKKPYKLLAKKDYYSKAVDNVASNIFYSIGKKNIKVLSTGLTKGRKIGSTGKLMESVMTILEDNKTVKKKNEKVDINFEFGGLDKLGNNDSLDFSTKEVTDSKGNKTTLAKLVFGTRANITFTNYGGGRGMTAKFENGGGNTTLPIGDSYRAIVPAAEIRFLVKTFNKLISSGSDEHSNDVKYVIIRQMLLKSGYSLKDLRDEAKGDKCGKLRTYLLNHYSIVIEPVVTLMRDDVKLTISYQDFLRNTKSLDSKFYVGNQLKAIVGNMGLYGTIEIRNKKKDIQNAYTSGGAKQAISDGKLSPYGYGIYRGCADIDGGTIGEDASIKLTRTVTPEITVSASVSTIGRSITTLGSSGNVGKDIQNTQYLLLKMHRVDFVDLGWETKDGNTGHVIAKITDRGNFMSIIPLDKLSELCTKYNIASSNADWLVTAVQNEDGEDDFVVNGVTNDTNFFAMCEELTSECIDNKGRTYISSDNYATVGFNNPTSLCEVNINDIKFFDGSGNNITGEVKNACSVAFNLDDSNAGSVSAEYKNDNINSIKIQGATELVDKDNAKVYAYDLVDNDNNDLMEVAFTDITDAYTGVYLGFGDTKKGNSNKVELPDVKFEGKELNKMLYNLNDYWHEESPLDKNSLLGRDEASAQGFFNQSLALDKYVNMDIPSSVDTTAWSPSYLGDSLRGLFRYEQEAGIKSPLQGYQAEIDNVGTVLCYDSIVDYDYGEETAFTARFTSISTLMGALNSHDFKNAYNTDGIELCELSGQSNIGVGYINKDANYVVGEYGSTNTRSENVKTVLNPTTANAPKYVENGSYQDIYRCVNLFEQANPNTAQSCEDAVLRISQSNLADASINLTDNFTYTAEIEGGGTAGDYNDDDNLFGQGDAEGTSEVQPYGIKLTVSQRSRKIVSCSQTDYGEDYLKQAQNYRYLHTCNYVENGVSDSLNYKSNSKADVEYHDDDRHANSFLNIKFTYELFDKSGNINTFYTDFNNDYDFGNETKKKIKERLTSFVGGDNYGSLELDSISSIDSDIKANFGEAGKAASQVFYIAIHNDKKEKYVATFLNDKSTVLTKLDQTADISNDDDDVDDDASEEFDSSFDMEFDDGTVSDVDYENVDSYISPDDLNDSNKSHGDKFGKVTEVHSNSYYEKMENGKDDVNGTGGYGSTANKRIATRVPIYDKLYIYDENVTDDINYLVFDYNSNNDIRYTYNKDMSIVDKISVTKSLGNNYMSSYSTSELPTKNDLNTVEQGLEAKVNNIIKGEGMKLEYIYAVPRVLTRKLKGSKQWVTNTCNIPALTKETESRVSNDISSFTGRGYKNRGDMKDVFLKNLSNADFSISGYNASPYFDSELSDVSSAVFSVGTWVRANSDFSYDTSRVALTSGQLKGYSIYYIYSRVDTSNINWNGDYTEGSVPDDSTLKSVDGKVTLKEYELNRVYDSIQSLTELHNNPLVFKKQFNFADASFTASVNQFDVDTYNVVGTSGNNLVVGSLMSDTKKQKYSYPCTVSSAHSGLLSPSYVASSGIGGGSINVLNTSYKVIDTSTGTLTNANKNVLNITSNGYNLVEGNKYVLQTLNWFKQGTLVVKKNSLITQNGLNINSALPFVPDYSINLSRHFFGDKRVLSGITSCEANANNKDWLKYMLGLSVGIKPTNSNNDVKLGMNNTTASETVKLGEKSGNELFGKECSDAFRLTAGWADGLDDNTDLGAKKNNRVVEIINAHHFDYNFILRSGTTEPNYRVAIESILNVSLPKDVESLTFSGKTGSPKRDKDNVDASLSFIKNDTTILDTDIIHRHDYQLAQLGKPAGTIFHAGDDDTTYHGVVLNIKEYAFRYNTKYQGDKDDAFASNTETPKNGILEFSNKTGAKLDGVEISSGSKVTNNKLCELNGYAYGYVNSVAKRNSDNIRMMFYPEVEMLAYLYSTSMYEYGANLGLYDINRIPNNVPRIEKELVEFKEDVMRMDSGSIYTGDTSSLQGWVGYLKLLTIGEELRKANSSELYVLSVKKGRKEGSFVDSDIKGKIASDGLAAGVGDAVSVGSGADDLPTIYAGSDVVLQADSDFTINMAGYALDLINDDDKPIYEYKDESGNKSLKTHSYNEIVSSGENIYALWGNLSCNKNLLYSNFNDWVKDNAVTEKFKVDAKLKVSNNVYSNFNISVGSVEPLKFDDTRESVGSSTNSYNTSAYTKKEYATGAYDLVNGYGILGAEKFGTGNTAETGCYQIKVSHGKIEKDDGGYIAMIKQLAVDYDFAKDYWSVDDEAYKKAEKIFEASGIYSSIFEAIESEDDESNESCRVATYERDEDGNPVKKDGKLVYKDDCYDERGNFIGVDVSNEDILGNDEHWYDERVYTMVIRRFESRPFYLKDITLSDKIDYANATTNTKIHSQLKDANVGKWYFTVYLGEKDKSNNPFADYKETNNNYCGEGKIFPEISFFNPEANNRQSSLNNAKSSGTVIMEDVWVDGADFRVPDATTGDMTAY